MLNSQLADFSMLPGFGLREIRLTPDPIASLRSPFPLVGCSSLGPEDNWGLGLCYRFVVFGGVDPPEVCLGALDSVPGQPGATSARRPPGPLFSPLVLMQSFGVF